MNRAVEQHHRQVISGDDRSAAAGLMRASLRLAEPFYSAAVSARNALFESGIFQAYQSPVPVVSVGNVTTGGTGKTPVVIWLTSKLAGTGLRPAVLLRGYKGDDEKNLLAAQLPQTVIAADPSRARAAKKLEQTHPQVNVLVLDDGFQHRKIRRDFDLVLIDASNPFGFDHVLPRGLLREPLSGLSRADAFLITHVEQVDSSFVEAIESRLRSHQPKAPILRSRHVHRELLRGDQPVSLNELAGAKVMTFCGIGNPASFENQIASSGAKVVGSERFDDHHAYTPAEITELSNLARQAGASMLITTEKDWVKIAAFPQTDIPILRTKLAIEFESDGGEALFERILKSVRSRG